MIAQDIHIAKPLLSPLAVARRLHTGYLAPPFIREMARIPAKWLQGNARQVVCAPPRHGKSILLARYSIIWYLLFRPEAQIILAANSQRTAQKHMRAVADGLQLLRDIGYDAPAIRGLTLHHCELASGGILHALGIRSTALGIGADLIVLDDPYRHILDAYSPRMRESVETWFLGTLLSRLHPGGSAAVIQQRMHPQDLAGKLIAEGWEAHIYPAIGAGPLFPERYPLSRLESIRYEIGDRFFSALYQQAPPPESGAIFAPEHFARTYDSLPEGIYRLAAIDTAISAREHADYTAISIWGYDGQSAYLLDAQRHHLAYPALKRILIALAERYRLDAIIVENANVGSALHQDLREVVPAKVVAATPRLRKELRAMRILPFLEAGRILLPRDQAKLAPWLAEHYEFPAGEHDDWVDATIMALEFLQAAPMGLPHARWRYR